MKAFAIFKSFRTKITLVLVFSMLFAGSLANYLVYEYSHKEQFEQLRDRLKIIAQAIALNVDAGKLVRIPLDPSGETTPDYKEISKELKKMNDLTPALGYIYILAKTKYEGIYKFIIDIESAAANTKRPPAVPGEAYDGSEYPELARGFTQPSADTAIVTDKWGSYLSGYAPILDTKGETIALLGVDMAAHDVLSLEKAVRVRALLVLSLLLFLSVTLGIMLSGGITRPVKKLVEGTRRLAAGDLTYEVKVGSEDEIGELAASFNTMGKSLHAAQMKLVRYFYRVVESLIRVLEARDPYTRGHSDRVSDFAKKTAVEMRLPGRQVETITEGGLLHDIGKLGIREIILNKPTDLDIDERKTIQKHPAIGEDILKPVTQDKEILSIVRHHHERYDGTGYPDGLAGENIGLFASIVAVADSYDAMTSHRVYGNDLAKKEAIEQLEKGRGLQFNPEVVDAFIKAINKK